MGSDPILNRLSWMIGGAQGSGVDSSAMLFSRACAYGGLFVYGVREYYSNIMGEHSYFYVRVEDKPVISHLSHIDLLATFDNETIVKHALDVKPNGGIIYDPALTGTKISQIPTLEGRVRQDIQRYLHENGLKDTVGDLLEDARRRGVHLYPIPYDDLLKKVADQVGETKLSRLARIVNTMAVSASFSLMEYPLETVSRAMEASFKGKPQIVKTNLLGTQVAHDYVADKYRGSLPIRLATIHSTERRLFLTGFNAVALGKIAAGCRFQTYYPISPATDESFYLEEHEVFDTVLERGTGNGDGKMGIAVVQTEDEIAAVTMACGAALAGARASTSTSGPGFSLMVEGLGWAGMNEVPVVVTLYQRGGPSTGLPTRNEQGDLRLALHVGHGEFPRIVLASGDVEECFYDAVRAFNYAEKYQTPVVHLVDKFLAQNTRIVAPFDVEGVRIDRGALVDEAYLANRNGGDYKRFEIVESGVSPRSTLGTRGGIFHNTGDEHDEFGFITEDPVTRRRMMEKRMRKLDLADKEIPDLDKVGIFGSPTDENLVVSWGSPKGAILEALQMLKGEGVETSFLQVRLMSPFPTKIVAERLSKAKRIIDVEMNYTSQLAGLVRENTGVAATSLVLKYTGRPITSDEVYGAIKQIVSKDVSRVVLTHGA